jgi:DNA replication protein DnaC
MRYQFAKIEDCSELIKNAVKKAVAEEKGIFLYGNTGVGKTFFCHTLQNSNKGKVENFVSLLYEFRDYIQNGFYNDKIKSLCDSEYLIIDDIGAEKTSDFVVEFLYTIVNRRYENMKRTVMTTNLSLVDFEKRYGDRILSRISEMCVIVEVNGDDKRLFKEDEKKISPITSYKDN